MAAGMAIGVGQNACEQSASCIGLISKESVHSKPQTVEEVFARRIEDARKTVESLCIRRAKLEALGMKDYPYAEIMQLLDAYPF